MRIKRRLPILFGFLVFVAAVAAVVELRKHVPPDPEYEQFIQSTGFQFERDLQEAAVAIHYATPESGGETRFSQVLIGKIDGDKLRTYLKGLAASVEEYRSITIYS